MSVLKRKEITDQIAIYIINRVIIPAITYKNKLLVLNDESIEKYNRKFRMLVKSKAHICKSSPNEMLHHHLFYNLTDLRHAVIEESIASYQMRLNSINIAYESNNIREIELSQKYHTIHPIFTQNDINITEKTTFLERISKYRQERRITFKEANKQPRVESRFFEKLQTIEEAVKNPTLYDTIRFKLKKIGIMYTDQLFSLNGEYTLSWENIKTINPHIQKSKKCPKWFTEIIKRLTDDQEILPNTGNSRIKHEYQPIWEVNPFETLNIDADSANKKRQRLSRRTSKNKKPLYSTEMRAFRTEIGREHELVEETKNIWENIILEPREEQRYISFEQEENTNELFSKAHFNDRIIVYTDGSVTNVDTPQAQAGAGIYITLKSIWDSEIEPFLSASDSTNQAMDILKRTDHLEAYGEVHEIKISWYAELMALYQSLKFCESKPDLPLIVYTDSECIVNEYKRQISLTSKQINKIVRSNGSVIWDGIRHLVKQRTRAVELEWIKGHSGIPGNEYADNLAARYGQNADRNTQHFYPPKEGEYLDNLKVTLHCNNKLIDYNSRKYLKSQSKHTIAHSMMTSSFHNKQNNLKTEQDFINNDWRYTATEIHQGSKSTSTHTTMERSYARASKMKLFFGLLPTMEIQHQRFPNVYKDNTCKCCNLDVETNDHVWNCTSHEATLTEIIGKVRIQLENYLKSTLKHSQRREEYLQFIKRSLNCIKLFNPAITELEFIDKAERISQYHDLSQAQTINLFKKLSEITAGQLIRGCLPINLKHFLHLIQIYILNLPYADSHSYQQSKTYAALEKEIREAISNFGHQAWTKIWKKRNKITTAWVKRNNINTKRKRRQPVVPTTTAEQSFVNTPYRRQLTTEETEPKRKRRRFNIPDTQCIQTHYSMSNHNSQTNIFFNCKTNWKFYTHPNKRKRDAPDPDTNL
jgi:ribonuclease HI